LTLCHDEGHPDLLLARYALAAASLGGGDPAGALEEGSAVLGHLTPSSKEPTREAVLELLLSAASAAEDGALVVTHGGALVQAAEASSSLGPEARDLRLATASTRFGLALVRVDKAEAAWPHLSRALVLRRVRLPKGDLLLAESLHNLATHRLSGSAPDEAVGRFEEAVRIADAHSARGGALAEAALHNLAVLLEDQGRDEEARAAWESALGRRQARLGPDDPALRPTLVRLARLRERTGSTLQAAVLYERAWQLARAELGPEHATVVALEAFRRDATFGDGT
jgi:tetratricopeptide (TPR) repeat protein